MATRKQATHHQTAAAGAGKKLRSSAAPACYTFFLPAIEERSHRCVPVSNAISARQFLSYRRQKLHLCAPTPNFQLRKGPGERPKSAIGQKYPEACTLEDRRHDLKDLFVVIDNQEWFRASS